MKEKELRNDVEGYCPLTGELMNLWGEVIGEYDHLKDEVTYYDKEKIKKGGGKIK